VQRKAGLKNGNQQVTRDEGLQSDAALNKGTEADVAFEDDQCADMLIRQFFHGQQNFGDGLWGAEPRGQAQEAAAAKARQSAADFGLEKYDHGQADVRHDEGKQRAESRQAGPNGHHVKDSHDHNAGEYVAGARAADHHEALIHKEGYDQNVDDRVEVKFADRGQH
jgi:hypothetical protein